MRDGAAFDLYGDLWRDCWIAATSVSHLRKRQAVDLRIHNRVAKLLEDYGPESKKPLSLRIYGTMIKGFCVMNNERSKTLFVDSERVVLMFSRQPFASAASRTRLPPSKRPKMEAALTLDLDLAQVAAHESFDWTHAPFEEGALLRLGGADLFDQESYAMPPSLELGARCGDAAPMLAGGLQFDGPFGAAGGADALAVALGAPSALDPAGWLPQGGPEEVFFRPSAAASGPGAGAVAPAALHQDLDSAVAQLNSQVVVIEEDQAPNPEPQVNFEVFEPPRELPEPLRRKDLLVKSGAVFGFDDESMLATGVFERWQLDSAELTLPRCCARDHAAEISSSWTEPDRLSPYLRLLLEPPSDYIPKSVPMEQPVTEFLGITFPQASLPESVHDIPELDDPQADVGGAQAPAWTENGLDEDVGGAAEAQDDRTGEVCEIIRGCLRSSGLRAAAFHELVPVGSADRATAACTFSALLALCSAGELSAVQEEPYNRIAISETADA